MVSNKEIPNGYWKSEVGIIPSNWTVSTVKEGYEICNHLRFPINREMRKKIQGKYPYYGPTKIQDYINEYRIDGKYVLIGEDGDHFLKWSTMPMTLLVNGKFNVNNHAHIVKGKLGLTDWFHVYFCHRDIVKHLSRQGANRYKLNKSTLETLLIALPEVKEQKSIVSAISDIDKFIISLEKLMDKRKMIQQGTVHALLTGKSRLNKFNDEWICVDYEMLFEKLSVKNNQINSSEYLNIGKFPVIDQGKQLIAAYSDNVDKVFECPSEGVIVFGDHTREVKYINFNFVIGADGTQVLKSNSEFHNKFIYYVLKNKDIPNTGYNRHFKFIKEMKFIVPPSIEEQVEIARILSDMDEEIEKLEMKVSKYKNIKNGMMEELLTGKRRLI